MGRPRSNYICPKCGKQGYLEKNPTRNGDYPNAKTRRYSRVVHYDSITQKKKRCYVENIIWNLENKELLLERKKEIEQYSRLIHNMSITEIQEEYLRIQREDKERRIRHKAKKEALELDSIQSKYSLPN